MMKTTLLFIWVVLHLSMFVYALDEDGIEEKYAGGINWSGLSELKCKNLNYIELIYIQQTKSIKLSIFRNLSLNLKL